MAQGVSPVAIVGAGIHGTAISAHFINSRVSRDFIALVDETPCCQAWERVTANMGMTNMRSPWEHYLAGHGPRLRKLAHVLGRADSELERTPPLESFNQYSRNVIRDWEIEKLRIPARVTKLTSSDKGIYTLELSATSWTGRHQKIRARNVVIATGQCIPHIPDIPGVNHPSIVHSSQVNVHSQVWNNGDLRILIVGGGLTTATLAVRLAEKGHTVHVAMREKMKIYPFDFPREWFENYLYHKFRDLLMPQDRAQMLKMETYGGSITPEYEVAMLGLGHNLEIFEHIEISEFAHIASGRIVPIWNEDYLEQYDRVILATGYDSHIQHLDFLQPLLPRIAYIDGFPIMRNTLEALPGLFFSGALARLGIGAAAANVYGADLAGRIILDELIKKRAFYS